jgi:hypothetical protein
MRYLVGPRTYTTRTGDLAISADLAFFTTGGRVNSTCYQGSLPPATITHGNRIRVNDFLQVGVQFHRSLFFKRVRVPPPLTCARFFLKK